MKSYSAVFDDVDDDREVRVGKNHSEFISNGDTLDHVSNGASDGPNSSVSFLLLKPHSESKCIFVSF